ncbi:hypothetical protein WB44_09045 [Synechococcus sp. WH 8020]|uniref:hypothetical protein n=1 Tax=Synechococcus sp. (strain WH8020) TaxID=32052 RepID=UPI000652652C|nr:hypothetical protein [Synechococcus sp. WH 8020]AKN61221.1 hypothetical protein WB44_09045 [Synechococcus sp. WH 8020]
MLDVFNDLLFSRTLIFQKALTLMAYLGFPLNGFPPFWDGSSNILKTKNSLYLGRNDAVITIQPPVVTVNTFGGNNAIKIKGNEDYGLWNNNGALVLGNGNNKLNILGLDTGIILQSNALIAFGNGNNKLIGKGEKTGINLIINSLIEFGGGNNKVVASGSSRGIAISDSSSMEYGNGNNKLTASASSDEGYGIDLSGSGSSMKFGGGNNKVVASGSSRGIAISNSSSMEYGNGNNKLTASASGNEGYGIDLSGTGSSMKFGNGNNKVTASGGLDGIGIFMSQADFMKFGDGNNKVTASANGDQGYGIFLFDSNIEFGDGKDIVTGEALSGTGIFVGADSLITTGFGNDTINAIGGFDGVGEIDLGGDNDQLFGFGGISADGGAGEDTLYLDDGEYRFNFDTNVLSSNGILMTVTNFELYGGRETGKSDLLQLSETTSFEVKDGLVIPSAFA